MKKTLVSFATLAILMVPASAYAAQCRDSATGRFAKCGTAGAVPADRYVSKSGTTAARPAAAAPAKSGGFAAMFGKKPAAAPAPAPAASPKSGGLAAMFSKKPATAAAPAAKPAAAARCKNAKGAFAKCGTAGAVPM